MTELFTSQTFPISDFTGRKVRLRLYRSPVLGRCVTPIAAWTAGEEAANSIVAVDLQPGDGFGSVLVEGNDFYSSPRLSPDGTQLAWLTWNHPNMPWDGCELWVGEFGEDGKVTSTRWVAGGTAESLFQPEWSPEGV